MTGILLAWALGCSGGEATTTPTTPPPGRGDAVLAKPVSAVDLEGFCDARPDNRTFAFPELTDDAPALSQTGWTWVNVWATWCGPCIEEMPRLVEWAKTLDGEGHPVQLSLMSTDTEPGAMKKFYKKNPDFPKSALMADGATAAAWITELGMEGAALPVHIWLDREHRIRCMRAGALSEDNLREVRALVSQ